MVAKRVYVIKDSVGSSRPKRNVVEKNYAMWGGGSATVVTPVEDNNGDIILAELQCVPSVVGSKVMNLKPVTKNQVNNKRKFQDDEQLDPEEEEKRRLRRDRNRLAAAKCRKRRLDQIETLQEEVEGWEQRNRKLEQEIAALRAEKEEMAFILDAHRTSCKLLTGQQQQQQQQQQESTDDVFVKMETVETSDPGTSVMVEVAPLTSSRPQRPVSLSLQPRTVINGVGIDTPSNAILSFDSLMEARTGLTPTSVLTPMKTTTSLSTPNCGSQQRSIVFTPLFSPNTEASLLTSL